MLSTYIDMLKKADLVPSRQLLLKDIEIIFTQLNSLKIHTLADVFEVLKSKEKLQNFAEKSGLDITYLSILVRELKSIRPKPNRLKDFPFIPKSIAENFAKSGFKNSKQLYDHCIHPEQRQTLAVTLNVEIQCIDRLAKLSDLSRIKWVNHTFAYMLLERGYETVKDVARAKADQLHQDIDEINRENGFYKGHIGMRDINRCIEAAKLLPQEIKW